MFYGGFEFIPIALLGFIVLGILALTATRSDPDPSGRRPYAIYLTSIMFIALFTALFSGYGAVNELARVGFDGTEEGFRCTSGPGFDECVTGFDGNFASKDAHISGAVRNLILLAISGAVFFLHRSWARNLQDEGGFEASPAARILLVYMYAVCFVAVLTVLGAASAATYAVFRVIAPGVSGFGPSGVERDQGFVQLISSAALSASAGVIFMWHWRRTAPSRART